MLLSLFSLFVTAFAAATILPVQSEALLATLLLLSDIPPLFLVIVGSAGNTLGACVNWWLGGYVETFKTRKWFPVSEKALEKAQGQYARYGRWLLLFSWVPIVGDPITVAAGVMKEKLWVFVVLVGFSKTVRYIAVTWAVLKYQHS